jgi:predicted RNA binding protein YcfA (HicA-like mRNA interferase family)
MSRPPRATGAEIIAALAKAGFTENSESGESPFSPPPDGRSTVVPAHSGETIGPKLLHKILRDSTWTARQSLNISRLVASNPALAHLTGHCGFYATRSSAVPRFLAFTTISTSCPSATRKRIRRSTEYPRK